MIKLFAIGSCRVYTPSELLAESDIFSINHDGMTWFTHSVRDAIQKVEIVIGQKTIDKEMLELVVNDFNRYKPERFSKNSIAESDVIILEICSLQSNNINGVELQQWLVKNHAEELKHRNIFHLIETKTTSINNLVEDIRIFHKLIDNKPLLLVTHINIPLKDGTHSKARVDIKKAAELYCQENINCTFYDPSQTILNHGVDYALKDMGHYHPHFNKIIAADLSQKILSMVKTIL